MLPLPLMAPMRTLDLCIGIALAVRRALAPPLDLIEAAGGSSQRRKFSEGADLASAFEPGHGEFIFYEFEGFQDWVRGVCFQYTSPFSAHFLSS